VAEARSEGRTPEEEPKEKELHSWGSWEERRREQWTLGLSATPAQRLAWLEGMIELAHKAGALPRQRQDPWGA
jgi:hypothetical protein